MIWGDGSALEIALGVLWCTCQLGIGWFYVFRIGRRTMANASGTTARIIGGFIYSCGLGHWAMLAYMGVFPHATWLFQFIVVPIDVLTLVATAEAGIRSPDVRG